MSQENVELIKATFDAFSRGDLPSILERCAPEVEFTEAAALPGARTFRGHQGMRDAFEHWADQWDDFSIELERIVGVGDRVVALSHHRGRGKASGAEVDAHVAYAYWIKDGKLARWQAFLTWSDALEAAGLRE